jgi:single-strand DNA-binding protein
MNCLTVKILIMNTLRNKVQLIGNLGNDPEILKLDAGRTRAKFALATNNTYRNAKGEKVKDTQWHTIIAWGKQAEILEQYATKGQRNCRRGEAF